MNITCAPTFSSSLGSAGRVLPNTRSSSAVKIASNAFGSASMRAMRERLTELTDSLMVAKRMTSSCGGNLLPHWFR